MKNIIGIYCIKYINKTVNYEIIQEMIETKSIMISYHIVLIFISSFIFLFYIRLKTKLLAVWVALWVVWISLVLLHRSVEASKWRTRVWTAAASWLIQLLWQLFDAEDVPQRKTHNSVKIKKIVTSPLTNKSKLGKHSVTLPGGRGYMIVWKVRGN